MGTAVADALAYLASQSGASLFALYWFVIVFEVPRYAFSFAAAAFFAAPKSTSRTLQPIDGSVSVIVTGHNEAHAIERCVRCLHEQSRPPDEIIVVSDGSTDDMRSALRRLHEQDLVDQVHCTDLRGGKAAAANLAHRHGHGAYIVNIDCDCSLDRDALLRIVAPFADASVGSVCGNIYIRNAHESLIAAFQKIEYLISISLGKQAALLIDQVVCVSGAFGAFRKEAFADVAGLDSGGGEDFDITLKLRKAGWRIHFAADAVAYTDAPNTLVGLARQRFRWERDAVRLRFRKHADLINPTSWRFRPLEILHEFEFLVFNILAAGALPFYIAWLVAAYGEFAPTILLAAQMGLALLDLAAFSLAAFATPRSEALGLFPYVFGYSVFYGTFMRFLRLAAYLQEWIFDASYMDSYVPQKVQRVRG